MRHRPGLAAGVCGIFRTASVVLLAFLPPAAEFSARSLRWFSRRPDHFGGLAVADLRLRGLDQRRDPPYRGHARSRPCSPPLRCRSRSAARSSTSRTSTTVRHEQRLDPPPQAAQAERRRTVFKNDWRHSNLERVPHLGVAAKALDRIRLNEGCAATPNSDRSSSACARRARPPRANTPIGGYGCLLISVIKILELPVNREPAQCPLMTGFRFPVNDCRARNRAPPKCSLCMGQQSKRKRNT